MQNYLDLVREVYETGSDRDDRTGTGTRAIFGTKLSYDLRKGFPLVTSKFTWFKGLKVELLWMLKGTESAQFLLDNNVHIWDEWMSEDKRLGRVYGVQWRQWRKYRNISILEATPLGTIDQLTDCINQIKDAPHSRRMLVTAWNPGELHQMALPPCHMLYQFYVDGEWLDIQVYQRSADMFLGVPFDIGLYGLLLSMVAQVTGKKPRHLHYTFGDTHIYKNHFEQVEELLSRKPIETLPTLWLNPSITRIDDFGLDDIDIKDYIHNPPIKAPVSI